MESDSSITDSPLLTVRKLGGNDMEQLNLKGMWWLPGKMGCQVSGNLSFKVRKKIVLELNGSFKYYQEGEKDLGYHYK